VGQSYRRTAQRHERGQCRSQLWWKSARPFGPLDVTAFALNLPGPSVPSGVIVTAYGTATAPATLQAQLLVNGVPAGVPKTLIFYSHIGVGNLRRGQ